MPIIHKLHICNKNIYVIKYICNIHIIKYLVLIYVTNI